eukprot:373617_1
MHQSVFYYTTDDRLYQMDTSITNPQVSYLSRLKLKSQYLQGPCMVYFVADHDYLVVVGGQASAIPSQKVGHTQILDVTTASWLTQRPTDLNH